MQMFHYAQKWYPVYLNMDLPGGSNGKESTCNAGIPGQIPGLGRSQRREWLLTSVFLPGEVHEQRSLASYNPWSKKESNLTE